MKCKYDVFISYSRKDYEGADKIIIPGNPISKIQEVFEKNGISYWFDKDGIYSSQEFIEVISDAIASSNILVFVSSVNSNDSKYTTGEIFEASDENKEIIPVRIDDGQYNKKFRMLIRPLDYIDYFENPDSALEELVCSINKIKEKIALKEKEEQRQKFIGETIKKIKDLAEDFRRGKIRQDAKVKELIELNESIGNATKECPVCGKSCGIGTVFCEQCGWGFTSLYALDVESNHSEDNELLALFKANFRVIKKGAVDNEKMKRLENECEELREKIQKFEGLQKSWDSEKKELSAEIKNLNELQNVFNDEKKKLIVEIHKFEKLQKDWDSKEQSLTAEKLQLKSELEVLKNNLEKLKQEDKEETDLYFKLQGIGFKMLKVKGGTFSMGATSEQISDAYGDEKPAHNVTVGDYFIGEMLVTQKLWQMVMGKNPSEFKGENNPVDSVSWNDCDDFIKKLNTLTKNNRPSGLEFRLPTEAEWEYAARGGSMMSALNYKYSGSDDLDEVAWYNKNSLYKTHHVGKMIPNQLGIYDMSGNLFEWCYDGMRTYDSYDQTNPVGPLDDSLRVLRGGSWYSGANNTRVSYRYSSTLSNRYDNFGLRLCLGRVL